MTAQLRRWHTGTLTEEVIPLATTYQYCARCRRMAPAHLVERDPFTGDFVHAGNCPYIPTVTVPGEQVVRPSAAPSRPVSRPTLRPAWTPLAPRPNPASLEAVTRTVARHTAQFAPPAPTPDRVRTIHEEARERAQERLRAAEAQAARDAGAAAPVARQGQGGR